MSRSCRSGCPDGAYAAGQRAGVVSFLKAQGFVEDRQSGSHLTLRHAMRKVTVTVLVHTGAAVGPGLAVRILRDAGFTVSEYLRLR